MNRLFYTKYALLFVGCVMLFAQLDSLYPSIMEARNFVSAREILASGDWLHTTLNGQPRYEKPPLPTWITAIFGYLFGTANLFALRIPNALLTVITGYFVYKITLLFFYEKKTALYASFIFYTAYLILYIGRSNVWDVYCYNFMLIAIYYFIRVNQKSEWKLWFKFSVLVGFSLLSKGPMGVLEVFIPFYIGYVLIYNRAFFKNLDYLKASVSLIIIAVIGLSWYYYIYTTDYEVFMKTFVKEVDARVSRNPKPWYRYLSFPVQMGLWVIPALLSLFFWTFQKKIRVPKNYYILLIWVCVSVFILSLVPEKKERYLFPVLHPLSMASGLLIFYWNHAAKNVKILYWSRMVFYILVMLICMGLAIGIPIFLQDFNLRILFFSLILLYLSIGMLAALIRKKYDSNFKYIIYMSLTIMVLLIPIMLPKFFDNPNFKSVTQIKEGYPNLKLYSVDSYCPEVWFEYQNIIPNYDLNSLEKGQLPEAKFLLLKCANSSANLSDLKNYEILNTFSFDENLEPQGAPNYSLRKSGNIYVLQLKSVSSGL